MSKLTGLKFKPYVVSWMVTKSVTIRARSEDEALAMYRDKLDRGLLKGVHTGSDVDFIEVELED